MIRCIRGLLILAALAVAVAWTNSACAQGLGYGGYGGYGGWFNAGAGPYNLYDNERVVPHFALYPPVYYSLPVPRTYGWSPFAYPPGMMTPEVVPAAPVEIQNPHVPKKASAPAPNRSARAPLSIDNPYVARAVPGSTQSAIAAANFDSPDTGAQLSSTLD